MHRSLPNAPTFEEAGVGGVELTGWPGLHGPPRMPEEARVLLGEAIVEIVRHPEMQEESRTIGFEPTGLDAPTFGRFHAGEVARWMAFMTDSGLRK
ncbi:MAG: hypothetical protein IT537_02490 [Hyphomicrobiales bacterium]|nr:hypothetical protein [Hyphomicrobiales bacterium]